jgi:hypothetical protein
MKPNGVEEKISEVLKRTEPDAVVERFEQDSGPDLVFRTPTMTLLTKIKTTRVTRVADLKGLFSTAVLQLQKFARAYEMADLLVVLTVPSFSPRSVEQLQTFIDTYAPNIGWALLDERGGARIEIPNLGISYRESGNAEPALSTQHTTHNIRAFTDMNRWLLKVLLLEGGQGFTSPADLYSRASSVMEADEEWAPPSRAKVYQFARTFRDLGLLRWSRQRLEVSSPSRVFDLWYEEERQLRLERYFVRAPFLEGPTIAEVFEDPANPIRYAVAGFEACRLHEVLHTTARRPELHIFEDPNAILSRLELDPCDEEQADFVLIRAPYYESIIRGVSRRHGLPVVDILQAALDVAHHQARGREQAEYIAEHVLGWR